MSIQFISKNHYTTIIDAFDNLQHKINIISPFITGDLVDKLCEILEDNNQIKCTIITRYYRDDFVNGVSNLYAIKKLIQYGADVYALLDLHTKLYIFDESSAMLGSANFTSGGFKNNIELSVLISDEESSLIEINNYFKELLQEIKNCEEDFRITEQMIDDEVLLVNKLAHNMTNNSIKYSNQFRFGAKVSTKAKSEESGDIIQEILKSNSTQSNEDVWMKFEGTANDRYDPTEKYEPTYCVYLNTIITCFPENKRPTGIKNGHYIYIAALSKDKNGKGMPFIVGRGKTRGFDKSNIANDVMLKEYAWMKDWPAYCVLYEMEYLDTEIINCIKLDEVLVNLHSDMYVSTIGKALTLQKLHDSHLQKSSIRLTDKAKFFIDNRFDELGRIFGIRKD